MKNRNPFLCTDGYKTGHHMMYPEGTTKVYSNFTPRSNKHAPKGCDKVVVFGTQMVMKQIEDLFTEGFFKRDRQEVLDEIKHEYSQYLMCDYNVDHIAQLHDIGFLPIRVKALKEGTLCPMGVPVLTIHNTYPEFYWVTNFIETLLSNLLWKPMTAATIAHQYKKRLLYHATRTDATNLGFVDFQGHNFSMRGNSGIEDATAVGLGHSLSFLGDDSLPTIEGARYYYNEEGPVVHSVNATEHSVMCAGGKESEIETFRRLLRTFPTGILSIVSDTWDLWKVCTEILPELKDEIMARDGKVVIRPDSGDPADIVCGTGYDYTLDSKLDAMTPVEKGVVELLWDLFGGTTNEQEFKVLDGHIGVIYGDSITLDRADDICARLEDKGFASTNVVLGIGSFTYQYNTRDTFGFAMKATYVEIDGEGREIFKDPITDDGTKKSAKGLLSVHDNNGILTLEDQQNWLQEDTGCLDVIYQDGVMIKETTLSNIRETLKNQ